MTIIFIVPTLCLSANSQTLESFKRPTLTELSPRLLPLFENPKTVCFGHFVVEVPATATVVFGPTNVDWPIYYYPGEADKLTQYVTERLIKVEDERGYADKERFGKDSMFGRVIDGAIQGQKLVFGSKSGIFYSIYSYIPMGADLFIQEARTLLSKDKEIKVLNTIARHLRLRADTEVPTEPGTCIEGGFVTWQPEFQRTSFGVRFKEFPDVHLSIVAVKNQKYLREPNDLERRLKEAEKDVEQDPEHWYSRIKFFRRGPRQLGQWEGYEVLAYKPPQQGSSDSHEFHFISPGARHDPLQPELDIQLDTGVKDNSTASTPPSITDEEAVALWDKLTNSIRVRPTNPVKPTHKRARPKIPLGKTERSGSICPQSGWWICYEPGAVAGGKKRHFNEGVLLPQAETLGERSLWQVIKGERLSFKVDTVWRLIKIDAEPDNLN